MKYLGLCILPLFFFVFAGEAFACLCVNLDTVCDAYANSKAVIIGEVMDIKEFTNNDVTNEGEVGQLVTFSITDSYKGDLQNSVEIWQPYSSCDAKFYREDIGKPYLLYLHIGSDPERLSLVSCGRSRRLIGGEGEVSWLNALPGSLDRAFFYGSLTEYENDEDDWPRFKAKIPHSRIELIGSKHSFRQTGDQNGFFEFWDLPTDTYKLKIDAGTAFRVEDGSILGNWDIDPVDWNNFDPLSDQQFEIDGEGCAEVNYDLMNGEKR